MNQQDAATEKRVRTEKDVAWSVIAQGYKCLWCAQPAIETEPGVFMCVNDPDCLNEGDPR